MNRYSAGSALAFTLAVGIGSTIALGQSSNAAVQTHVAAAKKAAVRLRDLRGSALDSAPRSLG